MLAEMNHSLPPADDIQILRGGVPVTYQKVKDQFAVQMHEPTASAQDDVQIVAEKTKQPAAYVGQVAETSLVQFRLADGEQIEAVTDALRQQPDTEFVTHVYAIEGQPDGAMVPLGTMTIQFKTAVSPAQQQAILDQHGLEIVDKLSYLPNGYTVRLTDRSTQNPLKIARALQQEPDIETAEPDFSFEVKLAYVPQDTLFKYQWHLENRGGNRQQAGADVSAPAAWQISRGRRDIVVAVLDDGVDTAHPDFQGAGKIVAPFDFQRNQPTAVPRRFDDNHGTACAGVAVAAENQRGTVGLAPECALMPIRMNPMLSDTAVATLFQYAMDQGADVISCSWSAASWYFPLSTKIDAVLHHVATQGRNGRGCVILFAAGNENRPLKGVKKGRLSHQGFALHPDVIAVGASNSLDQHADYSNFGRALSVVAPSSGGQGVGIVTTDRRGRDGYSHHDYTFDFSGTSSATPLVAGLAGLILSVDPDATAVQVKQIIEATADKIDPNNSQYDANGHSPYCGYGRINAHQALLAATQPVEQPTSQTVSITHQLTAPLPSGQTSRLLLPFPLAATIRQMAVQLSVTHPQLDQLTVQLQSPRGDLITLADAHQPLSSPKSVQESTDLPDRFGPVMGNNASGNWILHIENQSDEEGEVAAWGVAVQFGPD